MSQCLLLFTIGPVQTFIAQARKTRDLYAGSKLLSDLCRRAINATDEHGQPIIKRLIYPSQEHVANNKASLPNRFVAIVDSPDAGTILEAKLKFHFEDLMMGSFKHYEKQPECFASQIKDFLRIYWVMLPYDHSNYRDVIARLSANLGGIKNARVFQQLPAAGRKCSLCGEYNALFFYSTRPDAGQLTPDGRFLRQYFARSAVNLKGEASQVDMTESEGLCVVCHYKRFRGDEDVKKFHSTAKVALLHSLTAVDEKKLGDYRDSFKGSFDEQLYFEENLNENYYRKHNVWPKPQHAATIRKTRLDIEDKIKTRDGVFCSYYGLLMLDGDDMGEWLSGVKLHDKKQLESFHNYVSGELCEYAQRVRGRYVTDDIGKLVYAGGDDVLAFVNLTHLLDVTAKLFKGESDTLKGFPDFNDPKFELRDVSKATPSSGIVIAHYKTPLSEVIKWTKRMEQKAKDLTGKNAIGIALLTHSGSITQSCFHSDHLDALRGLIDKMRSEFSDSFVFNLRQEFSRAFEDQQFTEATKEYCAAIVQTELKRLMLRSHRSDHDAQKSELVGKETKEFIERQITPFLIEQIDDDLLDIDNFTSFFEIARFMAKNVAASKPTQVIT